MNKPLQRKKKRKTQIVYPFPSKRTKRSSKKSFILKPPKYIVNLDDPPSKRWLHIVDAYRDHIDTMTQYVDTFFSDMGWYGWILKRLSSWTMTIFANFGGVHYMEEMKSIADHSKFDLGHLLLLQLMYEMSACCSSVVVKDEDGYPHHIRCMDWDMPELKRLTIQVDFQKNGQTIISSTTWAGYVGILTGMRSNQWSISMNFRETESGSYWTNLKNAMVGAWPSGFLIRDVLETCDDYYSALHVLKQAELIAPCYFVVCGNKKNQAALMTRGSKDVSIQFWELASLGPIIQTNIDHWVDVEDEMESILRKKKILKKLPNSKETNASTLWSMMGIYPVLNEETIYGAYMMPYKNIYETRIPILKKGYGPFNTSKGKRDKDEWMSMFVKYGE